MPASPPQVLAVRPWSLPKRFLFRFALLYFVLYAPPFPFQDLWSAFNGALSVLHVDTSGAGWEWRSGVNEFFYGDPEVAKAGGTPVGVYEGWWQAATTWAGGLAWVNLEVIHQGTGSGDTAHDLLKLGISTVIALLLAVLWMLVDQRRTRHRALVPWLHLGVRWYLAFALLGYGVIKLYSGQFSYPPLYRLMNPIGETTPMGLVWTFMGFSKPYEVCGGLAETLGGLLLFSRRTSLLGTLVAIGVLTNVTMLNWMYDVPVKLYSANLLLFAIALTAPDLKRLWCVFFSNQPAPPADLRLTRFAWLNWLLIAFGTVWVGFNLYTAHHYNMMRLEQRAIEKPALYGVWDVEKMVRDGEEVAATDATRWKWLAIDTHDSAWIRTLTDQTQWLHFAEGEQPGTVMVAPRRGQKPPEDAPTWTCERGEKTVKGLNPAPKTMAEYSQMVDVTRQSLVLRGPWDGGTLELHLLRRDLPLERGFHLVQEMPVNR